jgi:NADP-dependent alcohol dehydrogenase
MIGHEITALLGITHGESLAMVHTALLTVLKQQKRAKLLQYADRVWHLTQGDEDQRITQAIMLTKNFFQSLGLRTSLSEAGAGQEIIETISQRFTQRGAHYGEAKNVDGEMARRILEKAL